MTEYLEQLVHAFSEVHILPINSLKEYSLKEYYSYMMHDFDRQLHDTRKDPTSNYPIERVMPIAATDADQQKLQKAIDLISKIKKLMKVAPEPTNNPACIRSCCCRRKKRCSCCGSYISLFGEMKQLGYVLTNMFNAEHHWIKTKDNCKLDAMFFRARTALNRPDLRHNDNVLSNSSAGS